MRRTVTWWGHATVLLEIGGVRLLTDPLLRGRVAHLTRRASAVAPRALGRVDAVLVSHVHRDHLDRPTLRALGNVPVVAPRGAARALRGLGAVHELAEGESVTVGGVSITAARAVHEARRGMRSVVSLGYLIDSDVYFAGDTDLFAEMAALAPLVLALLAVWGWGTSLGAGHLDASRAAQALTLLRPRVAVPIHWGTYFPAYRGLRGHPLLHRPPLDLSRHAAELAPETHVAILRPGESLHIDQRTPAAAGT